MKQFTLEELAQLTQAKWVGNPQHLLSHVDALDCATSRDVAFLANIRYQALLETTQAGAVCIDPSISPLPGKNYLISDNPSHTFQLIVRTLVSETESGFKGIHPTAIIHPTVQLGENVTIGPHVVIDKEVIIGAHTFIGPLVSIGTKTRIGEHCHIYSGVHLRERCILGNRVIIQPGAVIGSCGFGYLTSQVGTHTKLDQLGTVLIEDDVEIGANTTIDRARFKETRIARGSKIDNLVQIGHNVHIGEHNLIVAQAGIAGSSKTGSHVVMGGQVGVAGHVTIANGTMITAQSGVSKDTPKGGKYGGSPLLPLHEHNRIQVYLRNIEKYIKKIEALQNQVDALSAQKK